MPTKIRIIFKNRRFLSLIPPFLPDKTVRFSVKNHRFLAEKVRNKAVFCSYRFAKTQFYDMQTWQIIILRFLFRSKPRQ